MIKGKNKNYSLEEFKQICDNSTSIREVLIKLGYYPDSGSVASRIKKVIKENNINISHFSGQRHNKLLGTYKYPIEYYLNNQISITSHKLRLRLLKEGIFEHKCSCCGLTEWLGKPIPLELHHKNGNKKDNSLTNLELRCPNCHYFTDTYKTKNWSTQKNESAE